VARWYPMREAALLLIFVVVITLVAPRVLVAQWLDRAPRLGLAAWLSVAVATIAGIVTACVCAALTLPPINHVLADLVTACLHLHRVDFELPTSVVLAGVAGAVASVAIPVWALARVATALAAARRARHRHLTMLALAAQPGDDQVLVVDERRPVLYCLPGRRSRIVISRGALALLDEAQLAAGLDHERGHVRGRHHLVIGLAEGLAAAIPLPLLRQAPSNVRRLVELIADDHAAARNSRRVVAEALVTLATAPVAAGTLGTSGFTTDRVTRLVARPRPLSGGARMAAVGALACAFAVPSLVGGVAITRVDTSHPCSTADHMHAADR
jgi:Zn-dependent protease with chaperone function